MYTLLVITPTPQSGETPTEPSEGSPFPNHNPENNFSMSERPSYDNSSKVTVDPSIKRPPQYQDTEKIAVNAELKDSTHLSNNSRITVDSSIKRPPQYQDMEKVTVNPHLKHSEQSAINDTTAPPPYEAIGYNSEKMQQPPICLYPELVAQQPEKLVMKGEHWGSSATITNSMGLGIIRVEAESFSLSHRKAILDMHGRLLFTIRKETGTFGPPTYYFEAPDGSGRRIFELDNKWTWGASKAEATFQNPVTQKMVTLQMKGEFMSSGTDITETVGGHIVAEWNKKRFSMKSTYELTIQAGVDIALIVGMCVCLEDRARSRRNRSAGGGGGGA